MRAARKTEDDARAQVRAYFASLTPPARRRLRELRTAIRSAAPGSEEAFSYRIPAFRYGGRMLVWYAGFKAHVSLYPIAPALVKRVAGVGHGYETSEGTIRFPLDRPVPTGLVKRLVREKVREVGQKPH